MKLEQRDGAYLWDMLAAARETMALVEGMSLETFLSDARTKRAVERTLEVLGEAASRVSPAVRQANGRIPWSVIIGQRNVIAHGYAVVDHGRLFSTIRNDLPEFALQIEAILQSLEPDRVQ